ncbi:MAG: hypothetical protein ACT4NJ_07080 [Nitrosopumilaceae archaeon]
MEKWKNSRTIKIGKNGISQENVLVTIFSFILFSSLLSYPEVYSDVFDFDEPKNISTTPGSSLTPQIATLGSNVYIVWPEQDDSGNFEIFFTRSDDDGVTFPFGINNLSNNPDFSFSQQITAAEENVYVVWQDENLGDQDIFFTRSHDHGDTFNGGTPGFPETPINISNTPDFSDFPQIASVGNNVYVVWQDQNSGDDAILFSASHNNGDDFVVEKKNLSSSSSTGVPQFPQIASVGNNVYVVWQDNNILVDPPTLEVFFSKSNDKGLIFSDSLNLNELALSSSNPQVTTVGDNVYVAWESFGDEGSEILFSASHNNGDTFVIQKEKIRPDSSTSAIQKGSMQIAAAGDNVYVVWVEDDNAGTLDIFIRASNDGGLSFGDPINLSDNSGISEFPQIAAVDDNVFVVWHDDVSIIHDVFFASSTNGASSFQTKILSTPDYSLFPQIAVGSAHVIWQETTDNDEIFYNRGIETPTSLTFDAFNYKLSDTATITLTGVSGPGPKPVIISSSADPLGFSLDLIETAPGTYTGTITFSTGSSDPPLGILEVKVGDIINADFEGIDVTANIFPRTVLLLEEYTLSSFAKVTVEDQNSNQDLLVAETITVDIKSDTDQTGIQLDLKETDIDSGIFENKDLIFMSGRDFFSIGDTVTMIQKETETAFITDNTIKIKVRSTSDSTGIPDFVLTRTGPDTDFFEGTLEFTSGETSGNAIKVADGNIISIEYRDEIANGLIIPNPDSTVGAIEAAIDDTITVTYMGTSTTAKIVDSSGGAGRGGGGFIRPGLVLNVIVGIFGGGSGGGNNPPSFGTSSFATITGGEEGFGGIISDNDVNTLEQTKTFKVGEKAVLRFDFTEGGGIGKIEHIGLYTNVRDGQKRQDSDAYIYYDPLKSPKVTIHDPNGLFSETNFELLQEDVTKFVLKFEITFAKPMAKSDLILESWNTKKWSSLNKIPNAIEVISSGIVQEEESEPAKTFLEDVTDDKVVPVWVKSNAKWWSDDKIDTENFISGLEYLVNEGIISVSLPEGIDNSISEVHPWIKNTAGWWANDMISEDEFITAIEWMISNNIIQVVA